MLICLSLWLSAASPVFLSRKAFKTTIKYITDFIIINCMCGNHVVSGSISKACRAEKTSAGAGRRSKLKTKALHAAL